MDERGPAGGSTAGDSRGIRPPDFFQSPLALAHPGALRKPQPPTSVVQQTDWLGVAKPPGGETNENGTADGKDETDGGAAMALADFAPADTTAPPDAAEGGNDSCAGPPPSSLTEPQTQSGSLWDRFGDPIPLGQIGNTYIAASFGDGLLLVDQHAAHERLLFLELLRRPTVTYAQPLLVPMTVEIAPSDVPLMERVKPILLELGIEVDEFGGTTFVVRSVPGNFENLDVPGLIQDLLGSSPRDRERRAPEREWRERVLARMACRAAIKAGRRLSIPEMKRLLEDMRRVRMAFTCPHGRPTMIYLPRRELDRRFRRIV
jgi:DNA mismatch repair protein MutL